MWSSMSKCRFPGTEAYAFWKRPVGRFRFGDRNSMFSKRTAQIMKLESDKRAGGV